MNKLKILLCIMIILFLDGCSSNSSNESNLKVYQYEELTVKVPFDLEVYDETYGLIINGDDWKMTLGFMSIQTTSETTNAWEG